MKPDPHQILFTKARHLSREQIDKLSAREAWELVYLMTGPAKPRDTRPSVCFTGFSGPEEEPVRKLAEEKGLRIATSVLKDLAYLVTGISPGPKKIEKAKKQGCKILTEEEFRREMVGFQLPVIANDETVFALKVAPTPERKEPKS